MIPLNGTMHNAMKKFNFEPDFLQWIKKYIIIANFVLKQWIYIRTIFGEQRDQTRLSAICITVYYIGGNNGPQYKTKH